MKVIVQAIIMAIMHDIMLSLRQAIIACYYTSHYASNYAVHDASPFSSQLLCTFYYKIKGAFPMFAVETVLHVNALRADN